MKPRTNAAIRRWLTVAMMLLGLLGLDASLASPRPAEDGMPDQPMLPPYTRRLMLAEILLQVKGRPDLQEDVARVTRGCREILWAEVRLLELLESDQLLEVYRSRRRLQNRAVVRQMPGDVLGAEAFESVRARAPRGRVAEPPEMPDSWAVRDEAALLERALLEVGDDEAPEARDDGVEKRQAVTASDRMLELTPRELLLGLVSLQRGGRNPLAGAQAERAAGYVLLMAERLVETDQQWRALDQQHATLLGYGLAPPLRVPDEEGAQLELYFPDLVQELTDLL